MNYLWTKYLFYKFIDDEKIYLYNFRNGKDFFLSKEEFEKCLAIMYDTVKKLKSINL